MTVTTNKRRRIRGTVVSTAMTKTAVVKTVRVKTHSKYGKQYAASKKYKAHDPESKYRVGDSVVMEEMRPLSKDKRWRIVKKIS